MANKKGLSLPHAMINGVFFYDTQRWRNISAQYLALFPYCAECNRKGILKLADIVDHKLEIRDMTDEQKFTLPYDFDNLESLCYACHNKKTKHEQKARKECSKTLQDGTTLNLI